MPNTIIYNGYNMLKFNSNSNLENLYENNIFIKNITKINEIIVDNENYYFSNNNYSYYENTKLVNKNLKEFKIIKDKEYIFNLDIVTTIQYIFNDSVKSIKINKNNSAVDEASADEVITETKLTTDKNEYTSKDKVKISFEIAKVDEDVYNYILLYSVDKDDNMVEEVWFYLNNEKTEPNTPIKKGTISIDLAKLKIGGDYIYIEIFNEEDYLMFSTDVPFKKPSADEASADEASADEASADEASNDKAVDKKAEDNNTSDTQIQVYFRQDPNNKNITQYKTKSGVEITSVKLYFQNTFEHDKMKNIDFIMNEWSLMHNSNQKTVFMYTTVTNKVSSDDWKTLYVQKETNKLINVTDVTDGNAKSIKNEFITVSSDIKNLIINRRNKSNLFSEILGKKDNKLRLYIKNESQKMNKLIDNHSIKNIITNKLFSNFKYSFNNIYWYQEDNGNFYNTSLKPQESIIIYLKFNSNIKNIHNTKIILEDETMLKININI